MGERVEKWEGGGENGIQLVRGGDEGEFSQKGKGEKAVDRVGWGGTEVVGIGRGGNDFYDLQKKGFLLPSPPPLTRVHLRHHKPSPSLSLSCFIAGLYI